MRRLSVPVREKIDETIGHLNIDRAKIKMAGFALPGLIDREGTSYTYLTYEQPGIKSILEEMCKSRYLLITILT